MKIRQSFEQAICILLLIGASEKPIKSHELSQKLDVSDSYLKKVTRQLVISGLITSKASKLGGFVLNKNLEEISFLDIFEAIEGKEKFVETTHLVEKVFDPSLKVKETEQVIVDYLNTAEKQYKSKLQEITLEHIFKSAHHI
ncbi:Rrf2 family transcriptional regulator [Candidatus Stoquefichus massiliensis]|uniref:Rrf2 family transcriptional regulator n=1 Tax=Candidatus Stoquefichus massiliensis TaxID=1470350 RepID=UPI0004826651|nr:Rrf2 family transcriptional regulator [Candidatus Stoquefichus massiliensis]